MRWWARQALYLVFTILTLAFFLMPFIWMVLMAFKNRIQMFESPGAFIFTPTLENFHALFERGIFGRYLRNSLVTAVGSVGLSMLLAIPAAYGLTRFDFPRKRDLTFWILSVRMAPAVAVVIPYFLMGSFARLLDTTWALILAYLSFNVPFAVWSLWGFFQDVPAELDEAAMIDGCSRLEALRRVVLPVSLPGVTATAILLTIFSWNEFAFALFLTTTEARTLPTIVTQFLTFQGVLWGEMAAAATLATLPVALFTLAVRKQLLRGLTLGAVKE